MPKAREQYFIKFYEQTVDTIPYLQAAIYKGAASALINYEGLPAKIAACKWDIKDLGMDHNAYVNVMIKEFQNFQVCAV